jgi:hypothetical protein
MPTKQFLMFAAVETVFGVLGYFAGNVVVGLWVGIFACVCLAFLFSE